MFRRTIIQFVDPKHPLIQLANQIPWDKLEQDLTKHHSHTGAPAKPVRLMLGLLLLKQLENLSDEMVIEIWISVPYFQYFTGETDFQWNQPCDPSDLVHFRKLIGEERMELLLQMCTDLHKKQDRINK
jgi:IS5 family transposase